MSAGFERGAPAGGLLRRALRLEPGEGPAVAWSFAYFYFLLAAYFVIRPLREEMGIAGGVRNLHWLFSATFLAMLAAVPLYSALAARLPRRVFVPLVYQLFVLCLIVFWLLLGRGSEETQVWSARVFFVWTSVFNLFAVAVFWSFLADVFSSDQGARTFGVIAAGGTLGAMSGSLSTSVLVGDLGTVDILLLPIALLELAVLCASRLGARARRGGTGARGAAATGEATGGGVFTGIARVFRSPYLLAICAYVFLASLAATVLYFQQAHIVEASVAEPAARTGLFARMNLAEQLLTVTVQVFLTSRLIARLGIGFALALLPLLYLAGFTVLGLTPTLAVLVVFVVAARTIRFALASPAANVLFTVVSREEKYKSKGFIDTVVYRGGDALSAWLFEGLVALGLSLSAIAFTAAPIGALWAGVAISLGRRQQELAREASSRPEPAPSSQPR